MENLVLRNRNITPFSTPKGSFLTLYAIALKNRRSTINGAVFKLS